MELIIFYAVITLIVYFILEYLYYKKNPLLMKWYDKLDITSPMCANVFFAFMWLSELSVICIAIPFMIIHYLAKYFTRKK